MELLNDTLQIGPFLAVTLGIIVLFVVILGQGSAGKAMMRAEMPGPSHSTPQARMQHRSD